MQVVILAGGEGTRMLPATATTAKSMLPIAGRPFVDWQMARFHKHKFDHMLFCIGKHGGQLVTHLGTGLSTYVKPEYLSVRYSWEPYRMGTLGALVYAKEKGLLEDNFILTYGDTWYQHDMLGPMRELNRVNALAVMAIHSSRHSCNVAVYENEVTQVAAYSPYTGGGFQDSGCIAMKSEALKHFSIPVKEEPLDLNVLWAALINRKALAAYPLLSAPYEIGTPKGFSQLEVRLND